MGSLCSAVFRNLRTSGISLYRCVCTSSGSVGVRKDALSRAVTPVTVAWAHPISLHAIPRSTGPSKCAGHTTLRFTTFPTRSIVRDSALSSPRAPREGPRGLLWEIRAPVETLSALRSDWSYATLSAGCGLQPSAVTRKCDVWELRTLVAAVAAALGSKLPVGVSKKQDLPFRAHRHATTPTTFNRRPLSEQRLLPYKQNSQNLPGAQKTAAASNKRMLQCTLSRM